MKVLVLGGTGTIGRGTVPALLEDGHEVTVFARGETHFPFDDRAVRFLRGDRFDDPFRDSMDEESFEAVIDLVCYSDEHAEEALTVFGDVQHYLYVSTVQVFDPPLDTMPAEETLSPDATDPYGRGKLAAERVFREAHRENGFPATVVRPAHVWGPGSPVARQLSLRGDWIRRILAERAILVTCGGQTLANHCHARDAGIGLAGLLGREDVHGEVFNLTGPWMTWWDYHRAVGEALGREVRQVDVPLDLLLEVWPENPDLLESAARWHGCFSDEKLRRTVSDYRPGRALRERIPENVEWMRETGMLEGPTELDAVEDRVLRTRDDWTLETDEDTGFGWRSLLPFRG